MFGQREGVICAAFVCFPSVAVRMVGAVRHETSKLWQGRPVHKDRETADVVYSSTDGLVRRHSAQPSLRCTSHVLGSCRRPTPWSLIRLNR